MTGADDPAERRVAVRGDLALAVLGWDAVPGGPRGRDVLLVHGLASNARMWLGVGRRLAAAGHRTVAVDLRGHGRSDKPPTGYGFGPVVEDLRRLIGELGLTRPLLVGQSWGGNVVVEAAAQLGDAVAGLAAVDGGTIDLSRSFPTWEACRAALTPPVLAGRPVDELRRHIRAGHPDWPEEGIAGTLGNFSVDTRGTVRPWLTLERHLEILRALYGHDVAATWARLTVPALVLVAVGPGGDADGRLAAARRVAGDRPDVRIVGLPGHHDLHAQLPGDVTAHLRDHLTDGFFI